MHIFTEDESAYIMPPGHFGGLRTIDVVGKSLGGRYAIQMAKVPPGGGGENHNHDVEHQTFLVLEGEYRFTKDDETFVLTKGQAILFEPGEFHATINESDSEVVALVVTVLP